MKTRGTSEVCFIGRASTRTNTVGNLVKSRPILSKYATPVWAVESTAASAGLADLSKLLWTGQKFITRNYAGNLKISSDGVNWVSPTTEVIAPYDGAMFWSGKNVIIWSGGATPVVAYSADHGVNWYTSSGSFTSTAYGGAMASNQNGTIVAFPNLAGSATTSYWVSTDDGITWSNATLPQTISAGGQVNLPFWTGNMFISGIFGDTRLFWSTTGLTGSWTVSTIPDPLVGGAVYSASRGYHIYTRYLSTGLTGIYTSTGTPVFAALPLRRAIYGDAYTVDYPNGVEYNGLIILFRGTDVLIVSAFSEYQQMSTNLPATTISIPIIALGKMWYASTASVYSTTLPKLVAATWVTE